MGNQKGLVVDSREETVVDTEVQAVESSQVDIVGTHCERFQIDLAETRCFVPMSASLRKADYTTS